MTASPHRSDLVDVDAHFRMEREGRIAIWDGDRDETTGREKWTWLPADLVERDGEVFTMPMWLARDRGLV